jgi:hypothetical protein
MLLLAIPIDWIISWYGFHNAEQCRFRWTGFPGGSALKKYNGFSSTGPGGALPGEATGGGLFGDPQPKPTRWIRLGEGAIQSE